jgi:hypothetical protein
MANLPVSKIISALALLSVAERAAVRVALDSLGAPKTNYGPTVALYEAIATVCGTTLPLSRFTRTVHGKAWAEKSASAMKFIHDTFPNLRKPAELALQRMLINALADDLRRRKVPISVGSVVAALDRLPRVFENCFPGYLESGMAELVIKAMTGGKNER